MARKSAATRNTKTIPHHEIAIVGTGFSGLCMAIQLKKANRNDFVVFEKGGDVGGTWRDNSYPGCACDVPSHLYSFSFEPNPNWSRMYSPQPEIYAYLRHCAHKYGLTPHLQLNSEVSEARWDEAAGRWHIRLADGREYTARFVVSGIGGLSRPAYPKVPGLENFKGAVFHSAQWNHDYDLTGKRVAVIGTGASAIQFVPRIQPQVGKLHLFQRTAPWILPKADRRILGIEKTVFRLQPLLQKMMRNSIYWQHETRVLGFVNPKLMKLAEVVARWHIRRQIADPVLQQKVTPDYTIGCKRILISNDYYPALAQENVEVVTAGIREVKANSVIDSHGIEYEVDAVICGTGFDVADPLGPLKVIGSNGRELRETYPQGLQAYLGVSMENAPNAFFLLGPNTGLGHNSIVFMIESQVNYVMQALEEIDKQGARRVEVKPEVQQQFNDRIQGELSRAVWSEGGCKSWYIDENGKNYTLWPGFTWKYWLAMRKFNKGDFRIGAAA